jgi:molecular chaperone GrpE
MENLIDKEIESDRYLRLLADFENYKKRTEKEKDEIRVSTKIEMLSSILDIDSELALATKSNKDEGIKLIISKLDKFLSTQGIESIQTEHYDQDLHDVVSVIPSDCETGKIIDVVSKGYTLEGKPFRFPKIILSK